MAWKEQPILKNNQGDPVPMEWNEEIQDWQIATTIQKVQDEKLQDLEAKLTEIDNKLDGVLKTEVIGSIVEDITLMPVTAIREEGSFFSNVDGIDLTKYRHVDFYLKQTLNVAPEIRVYNESLASANILRGFSQDGQQVVGSSPTTLDVGVTNLKNVPNFNIWLGEKKPFIKKPYFRISLSEAPTSGSIEIIARGIL